MQIINLTKMPHFRFSGADCAGKEFGVIIVKTTYDISDQHVVEIAPEQDPFIFTDLCYGEMNQTSLKYPSDMVSYKPQTDVVINAVGYSPSGKAEKSWISSISVHDGNGVAMQKSIRVTGPRWWKPKWQRPLNKDERCEWKKYRHLFEGWELSDCDPITHLPIRYEHAFGGMIEKTDDAKNETISIPFQHNPLGIGWLDQDHSDHTKQHIMPQLEAVDDPVIDPYKPYKPTGFGAIPAHWLPRRPLGGTYDQNWFDRISPKFPSDYDFLFNNSATADLRIPRFLTGDIIFHLENLHPHEPKFHLTIPRRDIFCAMRLDAGVDVVRPNLDTLIVDIADKDIFNWRIITLHRCLFPLLDTQMMVITDKDRLGDVLQGCPAEEIRFCAAPLPEECATETDCWEGF